MIAFLVMTVLVICMAYNYNLCKRFRYMDPDFAFVFFVAPLVTIGLITYHLMELYNQGSDRRKQIKIDKERTEDLERKIAIKQLEQQLR